MNTVGINFDKLNNELKTLLEENKNLKQQCENLQKENNETSCNHLELKKKLQERDEQIKKLQLQAEILSLEKQKNELQQLEISQI